MKISLVQPDIIWEDKLRNLDRLTALILEISVDNEIVILPEMFNTGFSMNPGKLAEKPFSDTFEWMSETAKKTNSGICGSYIVEENNNYFNRWIFVSPENEVYSYDKRHLFSPGGENKLFKKGNGRIVFSFHGVRILPSICYDLRFPVWTRIRNDYDLLINSASWPESRSDVWLTLLKARAIENLCFVAGANRIGTDGTGTGYCGDSIIYGPRGEVLGSGERNTECIIQADISLINLNEFRKKFPVQEDADDFSIVI